MLEEEPPDFSVDRWYYADVSELPVKLITEAGMMEIIIQIAEIQVGETYSNHVAVG